MKNYFGIYKYIYINIGIHLEIKGQSLNKFNSNWW